MMHLEKYNHSKDESLTSPSLSSPAPCGLQKTGHSDRDDPATAQPNPRPQIFSEPRKDPIEIDVDLLEGLEQQKTL